MTPSHKIPPAPPGCSKLPHREVLKFEHCRRIFLLCTGLPTEAMIFAEFRSVKHTVTSSMVVICQMWTARSLSPQG